MKNVNSDLAYEFIRKRILSGDYRPGQALLTNVLADEIGVSRTPVRDALRLLELEGLVTIRARLGASVKLMDLNEFKELCGLRLALETYAAGLAAEHRTDSDLEEMAQAMEAMRTVTAKAEHMPADEDELTLSALLNEDVRFHVAIMVAARNNLIKKEILRLHVINRVMTGSNSVKAATLSGGKPMRDETRRRVLATHEDIFQAIRDRDVFRAKQSMEEHIQDIVDRRLRQLAHAERRPAGRELTQEELHYSAL